MASSTATSSSVPRPRKSPLRANTRSRLGQDEAPSLSLGRRVPLREVGTLSAADLRQMAISEFAAWLRGQTNKHKRPFQEHTITLYTV